MFVVFFSETLTWQQQQHNVATSVIMATNLNWRPQWKWVISGNFPWQLQCVVWLLKI
jgi:phage protein U